MAPRACTARCTCRCSTGNSANSGCLRHILHLFQLCLCQHLTTSSQECRCNLLCCNPTTDGLRHCEENSHALYSKSDRMLGSLGHSKHQSPGAAKASKEFWVSLSIGIDSSSLVTLALRRHSATHFLATLQQGAEGHVG